jgi:hypothetical protein
MATYLKNKSEYHTLIRQFISREVCAQDFTTRFIQKWGIDRDNQYAEIEQGLVISQEEKILCDHLDQIFSACDCYEPVPEEDFEIDEKKLWMEVRQVLANYWREI